MRQIDPIQFSLCAIFEKLAPKSQWRGPDRSLHPLAALFILTNTWGDRRDIDLAQSDGQDLRQGAHRGGVYGDQAHTAVHVNVWCIGV